jgi:selenocysteine lyase/cysteine desulfurase
MNKLNLASIRAEFPALNNDTIYLDNAGGSQVLRRVADRIYDYLLTTSVQLGASYDISLAASEKVISARRSVAELINASHDEEVVMGGSTTGLMFLLTQAILPGIKPGDEIIVTNSDHEANIGGWMRLQAAGAVIKIWAVNHETFQLELADLDSLLTTRTKWVAMTHASNVLGTINPVAEVARRVHAAGARLCVDGVAYAPHRLVDVQASGADVYVQFL